MEQNGNAALIPPQLPAILGDTGPSIQTRIDKMTDIQSRAAALVVRAIIETIDEMGSQGAPLGIMYAALMGRISYENFMTCIDALVNAGVIRVSNHVAYIVRQS
jgi:hypothetical protein